MTKFDWLEKLSELSAKCAREALYDWRLHNTGDRHGSNIWGYHRYDELFNADQYVEVAAITYPLANRAEIEIRIMSVIREPRPENVWQMQPPRGACHTIFYGPVEPEFFPELENYINIAYREVSQLNPNAESNI